MTRQVLILGASGRFGRNMAEAFWNAGWHVAPHDRKTDDLMAQARDAEVIVAGWNPAYFDWAAQVPGLIDQVITAARQNDATILFPGNVYVYGADAPATFGPDTPHRATNPLGQIRIDAERRLRDSGCKVIVLRAGDYLDTQASGNWFDMIMAAKIAKGVFTVPGRDDVPHAFAFLPDLARAGVALIEKRHLLPFYSDIAFPGYTLTGRDLARLSGAAIGKTLRVKPMSWLPIKLARPFWRLAAPLLEMRYLWDKPHHMNPQPFETLLPDFAPTPVASAVAQAVAPIVPDQPRQSGADPLLAKA